jgi:hypothetical protein
MLNIVLGGAILGATIVAFQRARPVDGHMRAWITPTVEPYVAVTFVGFATLGIALILAGFVSALT